MPAKPKLRFAAIGCHQMVWEDVSAIGQHPQVEMVAFCDVDLRHLERSPHWGTPKLYPEADFAGYELPDPGPAHHWQDWVDACLVGDTTLSDSFSYAGPLTEVVRLGNVAACFPRTTLEWEAPSMEIRNFPEAETFLTKTYREGWEVETVKA